MKYMYFINYNFPGMPENHTYGDWYGGDTEEAAIKNCIDSQVKFKKCEAHEVQIQKIRLSGDYEAVLKDLMKG